VYAYCPWVKVGERLQMLTPAVGCFAFSPSERYLAWVEGPDMRAVQVSELPSMRTVCTLDGSDFFALSWVDDEVLRVVRGDGDRVVVSRHAVPDGGPLGAVSVPRDGLTTSVQCSADGRAVLLRSLSYARPGDAPRAFLVGGAGDDDGAAIPLLHPRVALPRARTATRIDCVQSPDGRLVAVLQQTEQSAALWFAAPGAPPSTPNPFSGSYVQLLCWVSPSSVLAVRHQAGSGEFVVVDRAGAISHVATIPAASAIEGSLDLHPDRDQVLLCARVDSHGRYRTLALRVGLNNAAPDAIPLSEPRAPDGATRDGGACWDRDGGIVTLTQSPRGVANLMRRPTAVAAGVRLAHFRLIGERPVDLALTASPRREHFIAAWRCFDRGPADPVRRLALVYAP
jgi:hypothetical protein